MICFPNAKINIGLNILRRRPDRYHDIETVFYPLAGCCDILEAVRSDAYSLQLSGIGMECPTEDNLVTKAYRLLAADFSLPPMQVYLHKQIPFGAGLGGGSADAAFLLKKLNDSCSLGLDTASLQAYAARLGADCSFFIRNEAVFASGRGDVFSDISLSLQGYWLVLVKPDISVSTAEAYAGVTPRLPHRSLQELINQPVETWKDTVVNDFEPSVFALHPHIGRIKQQMYEAGALYASMSGSGSSVYGLFRQETHLREEFKGCYYWAGYLS